MAKKRIGCLAIVAAVILIPILYVVLGPGIKLTTPVMKLILKVAMKKPSETSLADGYTKTLGIPYVEGGDPAQVLDIYYADSTNRRDAVLIDIHGGFYVAGQKEGNRDYASVFLGEGFDVVLVEYRLNDGVRDVSDELADCASALDYLAIHAEELGLNKDRMFVTGDSAGGHLALYMAEGAADSSVPIRPKEFSAAGVLLSCPAYDFATFGDAKDYSDDFKAWFVGPRFKDKPYLESLSPRTFIGSLEAPLFLSTCTKDFIRSQSLILKADCDSLGKAITFLDIASDDSKVGHIHNVTNIDLPESKEVNGAMVAFMKAH
jgi:acetyl esterase/lipase